MCPDGCGEKVKEILSEQPGAKEVVVDFDTKTATVAVEDDASSIRMRQSRRSWITGSRIRR